MNEYTEKILNDYVKKEDLIITIKSDIEAGKLPCVTGNLLIGYVNQLPDGNAEEILRDAQQLGEMRKIIDTFSSALHPFAVLRNSVEEALNNINGSQGE